jgi:hypothetical protein
MLLFVHVWRAERDNRPVAGQAITRHRFALQNAPKRAGLATRKPCTQARTHPFLSDLDR